MFLVHRELANVQQIDRQLILVLGIAHLTEHCCVPPKLPLANHTVANISKLCFSVSTAYHDKALRVKWHALMPAACITDVQQIAVRVLGYTFANVVHV